MQTEVFRFANVRGPELPNPDHVDNNTIPLLNEITGDTALYLQLVELLSEDDPRRALEAAADAVVRLHERFNSDDKTELPFRELADWLDRQGTDVDFADFKQAIQGLFGDDIAAVVGGDVYHSDRSNLADFVMAVSIVRNRSLAPVRRELLRYVRLADLIERMAEQDPSLENSGSVRRGMVKTVILPPPVFPLPPFDRLEEEREQKERQERDTRYQEAKAEAESILETVDCYEHAIDELEEALEEELASRKEEWGQAPVILRQAAEGRAAELDESARASEDGTLTTLTEVDGEEMYAVSFDGTQEQILLTEERVAGLSEKTQTALEDLKVPLDFLTVADAIERLEARIAKLTARLYSSETAKLLNMSGGRMTKVQAPQYRDGAYWPGPHPGGESPTFGKLESGDGDGVPTGSGRVHLVGVADLMMVREKLKGYELGEVAHIENVLQGESKDRSHRRTRRTEDTFFLESESVRETERDLQSSERFELQKETSSTIQEDSRTEAGISVTGSYGPFFSGTADFRWSRDTSKESSRQAATSYSREMTERAVNRIRERVVEQRTRKTVDEIEEISNHGFDNTSGTGHVTGVYRWVDKRYEVQVVNYGLRAMLEFVVPEPAAFYRHALTVGPDQGLDLVAPEPPGFRNTVTGEWKPLTPSDVRATDYLYWVGKYNVEDVEPPPPRYRKIGKAFSQAFQGYENYNLYADSSFELEVPKGYQARYGWINGTYYYNPDVDGLQATVFAGRTRFDLTGRRMAHMNQEDGIIPISVHSGKTRSFAVNLQIECSRSPELHKEWQIATYQSIMTAYQEMKSEYDAQMRSREVELGVAIQGRNPEQNRHIEQVELRKLALMQLTGQAFDAFNAMGPESAPFGYPQMSLSEAEVEGSYVQFMEQALEWNHMTYLFYPYFWGRKQHWVDAIHLDDTDPLFAKFLRAGSGRVQVPVRPGYEEALLHFLESDGVIWEGGDPPHVDDDLYVSILEELRVARGIEGTDGVGTVSLTEGSATVIGQGTDFSAERDVQRELWIGETALRIREVISEQEIVLSEPYDGADASGLGYRLGQVLVGEPWSTKVPTSLVYLQQDSDLPEA